MTIHSMLKRKTINVDGIGEIEIQELSAKGQMAMSEAYKSERQFEATFIACQYGVPDWSGNTPDEIAAALPMVVIQEVAGAVLELSGFTEDVEKNSASAPNVVSF